MTLRKHGVGEVLPEPEDKVENTFSSTDEAELAQELQSDEKPSDSN